MFNLSRSHQSKVALIFLLISCHNMAERSSRKDASLDTGRLRTRKVWFLGYFCSAVSFKAAVLGCWLFQP